MGEEVRKRVIMYPMKKDSELLLPQVCDGHPDCDLSWEAGLSPEEQGCEAWGPWSPWGPCSQNCGPGMQGRSRRCSPPSLLALPHCLGPEHQSQVCFTEACPGEGPWGSRTWSEEGRGKPLDP